MLNHLVLYGINRGKNHCKGKEIPPILRYEWGFLICHGERKEHDNETLELHKITNRTEVIRHRLIEIEDFVNVDFLGEEQYGIEDEDCLDDFIKKSPIPDLFTKEIVIKTGNYSKIRSKREIRCLRNKAVAEQIQGKDFQGKLCLAVEGKDNPQESRDQDKPYPDIRGFKHRRLIRPRRRKAQDNQRDGCQIFFQAFGHFENAREEAWYTAPPLRSLFVMLSLRYY